MQAGKKGADKELNMPSPLPEKLKVLLVSNYPTDRQQSMRRFAEMMAEGLAERGHEVKTIFPRPILGRAEKLGRTAAKWLAYIDKYVLFQPELAAAAREFDIVHICDHSNSLYVPTVKNRPHLITCHDLLAVRAGLGEDTSVDLNPTGKLLQLLILDGLKAARAIVCDSNATKADVERLIGTGTGNKRSPRRISLVALDLNRRLAVLSAGEVERRLSSVAGLDSSNPFLLHVGSSLRRKNRAAVLRIFQKVKDRIAGQLVFCGAPLPPDLRDLADELGIKDRVLQVIDPADDIVEALYNRAFAMVYPSFSEGFGWPIIEAQACDCPVVSSNSSSCPEAAGQAAFLRDPNDEAGFAEDILKLLDEKERRHLIERGQENVKRFTGGNTVKQYEQIYYAVLSDKMALQETKPVVREK